MTVPLELPGLTPEEAERMKVLGETISQAERRAMEAERETVDRYVAAYLSTRVGDVLSTRITGVQPFGFFATVEDLGGDGLVPVSTLGAEYFRYEDRAHTLIGERIIGSSPGLAPVAAMVRSSHERWDGRGYPDRLTGDEIPLGARIVAVCDAFDAMTKDRSYRAGMDPEAAVAELRRCAGSQFDLSLIHISEPTRPY